MNDCKQCRGSGTAKSYDTARGDPYPYTVSCPRCDGTGKDPAKELEAARERARRLEEALSEVGETWENLGEYLNSFLFALTDHDKPHQDHFRECVEAWMKKMDASVCAALSDSAEPDVSRWSEAEFLKNVGNGEPAPVLPDGTVASKSVVRRLKQQDTRVVTVEQLERWREAVRLLREFDAQDNEGAFYGDLREDFARFAAELDAVLRGR